MYKSITMRETYNIMLYIKRSITVIIMAIICRLVETK